MAATSLLRLTIVLIILVVLVLISGLAWGGGF